ncbi:MAG: DHHW family protein [Ruminococcus sp.]|nr:DHHW family protein [Ruminococcus sp.]
MKNNPENSVQKKNRSSFRFSSAAGSCIGALLLLAFMFSFLLATLIRRTGEESYQENRMLCKMPEISLSSLADGSYFSQLGRYFADNFAGRSHWISAKGDLDASIGEPIVNNVYIADDMLLKLPDSHDIISSDRAEAVNSFAADYDGTVCFAAIPTSSGVYEDAFPAYIANNQEKQQIDTLYSQLDTGIKKIDAYNILRMLNDNYIYYRNDTKWTSYGAYCVYRTAIQKLGFLPVSYDKFTIEHVSGDYRGNLYNLTQYTKVKADIIDIYNCTGGAEVLSCTAYDSSGAAGERMIYDKSFIGSNDMYDMYMGEKAPMIKITTSVNNDKKLLVIKDSFADCFVPFLVQHYSEIAVIDAEALDSELSKFVDKNDYPQTLMLFGIDSIRNNGRFSEWHKQ